MNVPLLHAANILIGISIVATFTAAFLFYLLIANYTGKPWVGFITAIGFVATHAVLNYSQSGTAYVPGLACQIAALFFFERQLRLRRDHSFATWLIPGLFLALSIVLWFPYCLTTPSILAFALLYRSANLRDRAGLLIRTAGCCVALVAAVYAIAIVSNHITSFAMAHEWYLRSQYGKSQTKGYVRAMTGIPRGFFWLGADGVAWKRLFFQHSTGEHGILFAVRIVKIGWKLFAVYVFLLCVLFGLARSRPHRAAGQKLLAVLLIAAGPVIFFAIVLFEAGPPERYLPVFPMLFLGAGHILAYSRRRLSSALLICFFGLMLIANTSALSRAGSRDRWSVTAARIAALDRIGSPQDLLFLVSYQDDAFRMSEEQPFHPLILRAPFMRVAAELQSRQLGSWQDNDSHLILATWKDGHQVWISKRLLASTPKPDWNWVEGDDFRIRWSDLPAFFSRLQASAECGGDDGYVLLAPTPENALFLSSHASTACGRPILGGFFVRASKKP